MVESIQVIVVNSDQDYAVELRSDLLSVEGVKIIAETDDPTHLMAILQEFAADVVVVNLDSGPETILGLVRETATEFPHLSIFGVSGNRLSELILDSMRAGLREFLERPIDRERLGASLARAAGRSRRTFRHGRLISTVGSTGGSGATTIAVNLAVELASLSKQKAVLVDLDLLSGHVATLLGIAPQYSIVDLCRADEQIDENMMKKVLVQHSSGLFVLTSPTQFVRSPQLTLERAAAVIHLLTRHFEYVICDGVSRRDAVQHNILDMTDSILLVIQMLVHSLRNADRFIQTLATEGYNLDRVQLVVNRYAKENSELHPEDAEDALGYKMTAVLPSDWKTVSRGLNMGEPVSVTDPKSQVARTIRALAETIHRQAPDSAGADTRRKKTKKTKKNGFFRQSLGL